MSMSKYQAMSKDMFNYLNKGVADLAQFMRDLRTAYGENKDDVTVIKTTLLPLIDNVNTNISQMIKEAQDLVKEINSEVEKNVDDLKRKKDEVQALEKELAQLDKEKRGFENSLQYAENQARAKQNELQKANKALEVARSKLNAGKEERRKAQLAAKILWAIPIIGWIGASIATIVDCTALKDTVEASEHGVNLAFNECTQSEKALAKARNKVFEVNQKISAVEHKRRNKESKLKTLDVIVEQLKTHQKLITSLNEGVKNLDQVLDVFYGKVNVLASETDGGYSIDILKSPAMTVIDGLSKLMYSEIMNSTCGASETKEIWKNILEMEAIQWPVE